MHWQVSEVQPAASDNRPSRLRASTRRAARAIRALWPGIPCRAMAAALLPALVLAQTPAAAATGSAHRVITLAPHATELIYAAGGGHHIVGTVSSSDFPEAADRLPRVGDGILLNQERIIMLRPTLLVGWLRSGIALQMEALADRLGAQMLYSRPLRLRDIPAEVRRLGELLDTADSAAAAAGAMEARISALESRYADRPAVTVFLEVGNSPLYTIGDDPLLNDALRICGAVNIYAATGIPAPRVTVESVLVHKPQMIITTERPGGSAAEVHKRWSTYGLAAARQGQVHIADPDALYRPGPRLIDATEALCAAVDASRRP